MKNSKPLWGGRLTPSHTPSSSILAMPVYVTRVVLKRGWKNYSSLLLLAAVMLATESMWLDNATASCVFDMRCSSVRCFDVVCCWL